MLTLKELRIFVNNKGFNEDAIVTNMQLQDFVHLTHDNDGNIMLCTSKPIGFCNRTGEYVYPSVVKGYSAYCPELDEDLYDMEWIRIDDDKCNLKQILDDVELSEFPENNFTIFFDFKTKRFHAFENNVQKENVREFIYELVDTEKNIITKHRKEILNYCLAIITKDDTVGLGDIFIHGKYIKRIS